MANLGPASQGSTIPAAANASPNQGFQVGASALALVGIWGATPVAQSSPAGLVATATAGSTTSVFVNTTFTGGIGSTAYTCADIIAALKQIGILKA